MKKRFDRITKSQLGKRGLAVVLCFVMLISAIVVGNALTTLTGGSAGGAIPASINAVIGSAKQISGTDATDEDGALNKKGDTDLAGTGWDTTNCGVHYKLGSGSYSDVNTNSSGLATITVTSSTTLTYTLFAEYSGAKRWYKKANSTGNPSSSSSQSDNYYAKYEKSGGNAEFTVSVTAGTYNFQFGEIQQSGDQLLYHFWKTNTSYTISYNTPTNGSFTTKPTSATSGSSVSFVATPATGYTVDTVTITNSSTSNAITPIVSGTTYTFTMPSANVSVSATFKKATYTINASAKYCTVSGFTSPAEYGSTVFFTVTPNNDYALKTLTVKQGSTSVSVTDGGSNSYSFTMPAGNVTITAVCATTTGTAEIYFKSATAWVYHPFITVNDGAEQEMTLGSNPQYLDNGPKSSAVKPKSDTGSLRYAWYKITLSGVDTSKPVTIKIRGNDTYMEATGTFTINAGDALYLACDNLMEGSTLVDLSTQEDIVKDFYDTPLHMVATAAEIAAMS